MSNFKKLTLDDLKAIKPGYQLDCFIWLNGARSSKTIYYDNGLFTIYNDIDDTFDNDLTEEQLFDRSITNVGYAITCGQLYAY